MSYDVGSATEGLENELWRRWSDGEFGEWAELIVVVIVELILQAFRDFTYVTAHSPTLPSLYLRHSSFSNTSVSSPTSQLLLQPFVRFSEQSSFSKLSVTSPTSQLILQPFRRFTYATAQSPTLPILHLHHSSFSNPFFAFMSRAHSPSFSSLNLRHGSFYNPSFTSSTSQALHLRHLASRPCYDLSNFTFK